MKRAHFSLLIFLMSILAGYYLKVGEFFAQTIGFVIIVLLNIDIVALKFKRIFFNYPVLSIWFIFSVIVTSFFAIDPYVHLQSFVRLLLIVFVTLFFYHVLRTRRKVLLPYLVTLMLLTGGLSALELLGVSFYPLSGNRFGLARPFLYANPITLSVMLACLTIYFYSYSKRLAFFGVLGLLSFTSFTGFLIWLRRSKLFPYVILGLLLLVLAFFLQNQDLGSLLIRLAILQNSLAILKNFDLQNLFFGVGLRNLDAWNVGKNVLTLTNDMTMYLKVFFELGVIGFIWLLSFLVMLWRSRSGLFFPFLVVFLSIDQVYHLWILPFLFLAMKVEKSRW